MRIASARALARIGTSGAVPALIRAFGAASPEFREAIVAAVLQLEPARVRTSSKRS